MLMEGMKIIANEHLPPDFFAISDWVNARESATPQWLNLWILEGNIFAHPKVIAALSEAI